MSLWSRWVRIASILFVGWVGWPAHAEMPQVILQVDGVACAFCAYGLEKKLKRLEGVQTVEIRLNTGTVTLKMVNGKTVNLARVRTAVREAGFTLRQVKITVIGTLVVQDKRIVLLSRGGKQTYLLFGESAENANLPKATHQRLLRWAEQQRVVLVTGSTHPHPEGPPGLRVEKVQPLSILALYVEGVRCEQCSARVRRALQKLPNVYRVAVNVAQKRVIVEGFGPSLPTKVILQTLQQLGFQATVQKRNQS